MAWMPAFGVARSISRRNNQLRRSTTSLTGLPAAIESRIGSFDRSGGERNEGGKKKILVVDDDPDIRLSLDVRLTSKNYEVVLAEDGATALSQAAQQSPDLILLDLGLPAGDGFSVMKGLQANNRLSSIPVIVLTGRDVRPNKLRAFDTGARAFAQKPVDNLRLLALIQQVLNGMGHRGKSSYVDEY